MSSNSSPPSPPPPNLTLDEALARSRQNQRRFWLTFLLWGLAAGVALVKFYDVAQNVKRLRQDLDESLTANRTAFTTLTREMDSVSRRRDEIKQDIDLKLLELRTAIADSHRELKEFDQQRQTKINELTQVLSSAQRDIEHERKEMETLKKSREAQQQTLVALQEELTALKADLKNAIEEVKAGMGQVASKVTTLEGLAAAQTAQQFATEAPATEARELVLQAIDLIKADQATEAITKLDDALPRITDNSFKALALALRASAKNSIGLENSALVDASAAIQTEPGNADFHALRAAVYHDLEKPDEAKADLEESLRLEPDQARPLQQLGHLYLKHYPDTVPQAITAFSRALALKPADLTTLGERALAYLLAGKFQEAAQDLNTALPLCGTDANARARTLESQALLALKQGQVEQALNLARQADASEPKRLWTTFLLAATLREANASNRATQESNRAESARYAREFTARAAKSKADAFNVKYLRRFLPRNYQQWLDELLKPAQN